MAVKDGDEVTAKNTRMFVSDFDLMCIWRPGPKGLERVIASAADGANRGKYPPAATNIIKDLNKRLISKKASDHFVAFRGNTATHLGNPNACAQYCKSVGIPWPYDLTDRYSGPKKSPKVKG